MGGTSSKEQKQPVSSTNYANGDSSTNCAGSLQSRMQEPLYTGAIQTLCPLGEDSLLSGGMDKDVVLYNWMKHSCLARFKGPSKDITKVVYNPKSHYIHAASRDRFIYGWKWPPENSKEDSDEINEESKVKSDSNGESSLTMVLEEPCQTMVGHSLGVTSLACSPDYPQLLCSGSRDNSVGLWDTDTGKSLSIVSAPRNLVTELQWIGSEMSVLQSSEDKTLRVWDLRACSLAQHFRARNKLQTCCSVSHDHQQFLAGSSGTGSEGAELVLWDRRNEKRPIREYKGHTESINGCFFTRHQNQQLLVSAGDDSTVKMWNSNTSDCLCSTYLSGAGPLMSIVSPAPELVGCGTFKAGVMIWTLLNDSDKWNLTVRATY